MLTRDEKMLRGDVDTLAFWKQMGDNDTYTITPPTLRRMKSFAHICLVGDPIESPKSIDCANFGDARCQAAGKVLTPRGTGDHPKTISLANACTRRINLKDLQRYNQGTIYQRGKIQTFLAP